jgi:ribosomal protein S7
VKNNLKIIIDKLQKSLLVSGGSSKSRSITFNLIKDFSKSKKNSELVISNALDNVSPLFLLKTRKKGKKVTQSPVPITKNAKRFALSAKMLVKNSKKHKTNGSSSRLLLEINDASLNQGFTKKQQQELNKLVVINRAALFRN